MNAYFAGFFIGLSLIIVIGAQNAFVLRQGLKRSFVFSVCLICALSDTILIAAGVLGFHLIIKDYAWLIDFARYAGALFLIAYGVNNLLSAWRSTHTLAPSANQHNDKYATVVLTCLALTWLNPHVYLDTVFLIGSVSTQYSENSGLFFLGAATASFTFFFTLGYGAKKLAPLFNKPRSWQIVDSVTAIIMLVIAADLLLTQA